MLATRNQIPDAAARVLVRMRDGMTTEADVETMASVLADQADTIATLREALSNHGREAIHLLEHVAQLEDHINAHRIVLTETPETSL